jgi:hypothetical protein
MSNSIAGAIACSPSGLQTTAESQTVVIICAGTPLGRYVTIVGIAPGTLKLCEVEVYPPSAIPS